MLAALLLIGGAPVRAEQTAPPALWHARAGAATAYLDRAWGKADGWHASENWQRFPIADALMDYQRRTGDPRWAARVAAAVRNRAGLYLN